MRCRRGWSVEVGVERVPVPFCPVRQALLETLAARGFKKGEARSDLESSLPVLVGAEGLEVRIGRRQTARKSSFAARHDLGGGLYCVVYCKLGFGVRYLNK